MAYNYTYNMTFDDDVNNTEDFFTGINSASNGLASQLTIASFWFIIFFVLRNSGADTLQAFTASSFAISIISSLFFFLGWISWGVLLIPIMMLIFGIIALNFR